LILKTKYKSAKTQFDKNIPLVLLALEPATETFQYPGGLTFTGWKFGFNSYAYSPDAYQDDDTGYSNELLYDPVDTIRRHFSLGPLGNGLVFPNGYLIPGIIYQVQGGNITYNNSLITDGQYFTCLDNVINFTTTNGGYCVGTSWLTQDMVTIFNNWAFAFTLNGIDEAETIDESGLILGYKIGFESVALDPATEFVNNTITLESFTQLPFGPAWILQTGFWESESGGYPTVWIDSAVWLDSPIG